MARSRGFSQGRARPRSSGVARSWDAGPGGTAVTVISSSSISILGAGITPVAGVGTLTVLRTRGILDLFLRSNVTADGDGFFGAVAMGVVSATAFGVGVTAVPSPITDPSFGWMWHSFISCHQGEISGSNMGAAGAQRLEIDGKAMRKLGPEEFLFAVIEVVEIGSAVLHVSLDSRILAQDSGR